MPEIFLTVYSVNRVGLWILTTVFAVYLFVQKDKSTEHRWFSWMMASWSIMWFMIVVSTAVDVRSPIWPLFAKSIIPVMVFGILCVVQFFYVYQKDVYPRERQIAGILMAFIVALIVIQNLIVDQTTSDQEILAAMLTSPAWIWALVVLLRKRRVMKLAGEARVAASFLPYLIIPLIASFSGFTRYLAREHIIGLQGALISDTVANTSFILTLIVGYVHYSRTRITVQVKLLAITLATVVTILASGFSTIYPTAPSTRNKEDFKVTSSLTGIAFRPQTGGGYVAEADSGSIVMGAGFEVESVDFNYHPETIGFEFPFYGASYDSVFVSSLGMVGFDGSTRFPPLSDPDVSMGTLDHPRGFFDSHPGIALHAGNVSLESGSLWINRTDSTFVLTWADMFSPDSDSAEAQSVSAQLKLTSSGEVFFYYQNLEYQPSFRGIYPGNRESFASSVNFEEDLPLRAVATSPLMETKYYVSKNLEHEQAIPLLIIMLVSCLIVMGVFPFLFKTSILSPLDRLLSGVRRVNEGDYESTVAVQSSDEIGLLTEHFNEMTVSLKGATQELEDRVARRTEELSRSLEDLHATQAQLVQQEKLASLGSLTAGIAHEIKNPLNFVNNFAEVGVEMTQEVIDALEAGDPDEAKAILKEMMENSGQIAKHGKRADSIVRSMMQHARGGTSVHEQVDVAAFLEENINLAWHGRRAKDQSFQADVVRDLADNVGEVRIQPMEMGRVILNLLNNAFDAVSGVEGANVSVSANRSVDGVAIIVADNGHGIPDENREKIFEPFFTTKGSGEGTGLGLSLSHDIVTKGHGGTMVVRDAKGGGAEFVITLPASA